jgi:octaprenyl-diphosphate synthase
MDYTSPVAPVADEFNAVRDFIFKSIRTDVGMVLTVSEHTIGSGGKLLRPLVCLLSARASGYAAQDQRPVQLAAIVEMLHNATLMHDDVVDDSRLRRGRATANARWDNPTAVLVGDYLISRAFQLIVGLENPELTRIMADSSCVIAEGEVLQLGNQGDPDTTEAQYMDVIYRKTARLFEAAAACGAELGNPALRKAFEAYARHLGNAFQIVDDVLDYTGSAEVMGKNVGDDLAEGKPTLPLIHAMKVGQPAEIALLREAILSSGIEHLAEIIRIVQDSGALDYTYARAAEESRLAVEALAPVPDSAYKQALIELTRLALKRDS